MDDSHTFFWLVGILEGEGSFVYMKARKEARVEVEMKDEAVVARIAALFGISYLRRDRRDVNPNRAVTYRVVLVGYRALQLMKRLESYMSPRRVRAIEKAYQSYLLDHPKRTAEDFSRIVLPPLTEVPYTVQRIHDKTGDGG